jgi:cellulose synthase/poly-beta-1,6-N-acetylglucosamine synthase-like glycosyltransferase
MAIVVTVLAWLGYVATWIFQDLLSRSQARADARVEAIVYLLIVTALSTSTVAYLLGRLGFFYRARAHHRAGRAALDDFYERTTPSLTALVPSYQEDARVIRNTLLSAALQEYPDLRIVLLIDDPPAPRTSRNRELLAAAESLPREIEELLAWPATHFGEALDTFEASAALGGQVDGEAIEQLAREYDTASSWLENLAAGEDIVDHADAFMANEVVRRLGEDLGMVATALRQAAAEGASLPLSRTRQLYRRLAWTFKVELSSFQRKRYVSLSHEPNKAMNLNSYLGLMGRNYNELHTVAGTALVVSESATSDLSVPDPDYVLTLDADSVLLPEYCLRLVYLLEQQEHRHVAIAQTPYSAFPGSSTRLERIAGATTDLQHLVHQGLTYYEATFWVGANAVIRKRALDEIAVTSYLGDWEIRSYIRDRTVIEDTESTIDLGIHGWSLFNCPERLSYSATPPDF